MPPYQRGQPVQSQWAWSKPFFYLLKYFLVWYRDEWFLYYEYGISLTRSGRVCTLLATLGAHIGVTHKAPAYSQANILDRDGYLDERYLGENLKALWYLDDQSSLEDALIWVQCSGAFSLFWLQPFRPSPCSSPSALY